MGDGRSGLGLLVCLGLAFASWLNCKVRNEATPGAALAYAQSGHQVAFEHALLQMGQAGLVTQEEALANADSATNLLWLLNNGPAQGLDDKAGKPDAPPAPTFTEFTLDT